MLQSCLITAQLNRHVMATRLGPVVGTQPFLALRCTEQGVRGREDMRQSCEVMLACPSLLPLVSGPSRDVVTKHEAETVGGI